MRSLNTIQEQGELTLSEKSIDAKYFKAKRPNQSDILDFDVTKQSIGRVQNGFVFKRNADLILVTGIKHEILRAIRKRGIPAEKVIMDFFVWDYSLMPFWDKKKFLELLNIAESLGVNKIVQMDFSIFYSTPEPMIQAHIFKNFQRMQDAIDKGFKVIYNFNCFIPTYLDFYKDVLPKEISLVIDQNHVINKITLAQDLFTLRELAKITKIKNAILLISSQKTETHMKLLTQLNRLTIPFTILPSYFKMFQMLSAAGKIK